MNNYVNNPREQLIEAVLQAIDRANRQHGFRVISRETLRTIIARYIARHNPPEKPTPSTSETASQSTCQFPYQAPPKSLLETEETKALMSELSKSELVSSESKAETDSKKIHLKTDRPKTSQLLAEMKILLSNPSSPTSPAPLSNETRQNSGTDESKRLNPEQMAELRKKQNESVIRSYRLKKER